MERSSFLKCELRRLEIILHLFQNTCDDQSFHKLTIARLTCDSAGAQLQALHMNAGAKLMSLI